MVTDDTKQPKAAIWTVALAVLTIILTYWKAENKLGSARPHLDGGQEVVTLGDQKYLARLWQDPLLDAGTNTDGILLLPALQAAIGNKFQESTQVSVLAVMLGGFPYPEDVEVRLRTRYAVENALFDRDYTLSDGSHLGLTRFDWPTTDALKNGASSCHTGSFLTIPFEWANRGKTNKVLVLWLREEAFADYPLTRIAMVMKGLGITSGQYTNIPFRLIGPRTSDTLHAMLVDRAFTNNWNNIWITNAHDILMRQLFVFSPEASAPDPLIAPDPESSGPFGTHPRDWVKYQFDKSLGKGRFQNFILTDDVTALRLVQELDLRHISVTNAAKSLVVLLSEEDTSYGRALPFCFAAGVNAEKCRINNLADELIYLKNGTDPWPTNVKTFSYLRGLDGTLAEQNGAATNSTPDDPLPSRHSIRNPDDYERSQGESQLDYARRLADKLYEQYGGESHPLDWRVAIGVLGSDTYDKIILLEALRNKFRDATFFSTDLDARYIEPQEQDITRNLLVASAEGLDPLSHDRHGRASFRDAYQTTVFNASVNALDGNISNQLPIRDARMFEIGRHHIIELDEPSTVWRWWNQRRVLGMILAIIGIAVCLTLVQPMARAVSSLALWIRDGRNPLLNALDNEKYLDASDNASFEKVKRVERKEDSLQVVMLLAGFIVILCLAIRFYLDNDMPCLGEPFYWTEGVSIWPTELFRTAASIFGIVTMIHSRYLYKRIRLRLVRNFFGPPPYGPPLLQQDQIDKPGFLASAISTQPDPLAAFLYRHFDLSDKALLAQPSQLTDRQLEDLLLRNLNRIIANRVIYDPARVPRSRLRRPTLRLLNLMPQGELLIRVNRLVLEDYYRDEIKPRAPISLPVTWPIPRADGGPPKLAESPTKPPAPEGLVRKFFLALAKAIRRVSINFWPRIWDYVSARNLAFAYFRRVEFLSRCKRMAYSVIPFIALAWGMFLLWDFPIVPGRGDASFIYDRWILIISVFVFIFLAFYIIDACRLFNELLRRLGDGVTVWPQHVVTKAALDRNVDPSHLSGYVDVSFVAMLSQQLGRIYYYPFIMLTMMLLARNEVFAPWTWPLALLLTCLTVAVMVFIFSFHVRRSAARVRNQAIEFLRRIETRTIGDEAEKYRWTVVFDDGTKKQCAATNYAVKIQHLILELQGVKTGAYAKILQDDSVIAALIPTFGAALLQIFPKLFL